MKRLVGIFLLITTACSAGVPGNGGLIPDSPPPAQLVIGDQEQLSGIGSYCWSGSEGTAVCADMIGLPTPRQALQTVSPFTAELTLPLAEVPDWLSVTWIRAEEDMRLEFTAPDQIFWQPYGGQELPVEMAVENRFEIEAEPGLYLLSVYPSWEPYGGVSYGFLVEVTAP